MKTNGVLLIYTKSMIQNASTIEEHINSFAKHSKFKIWAVNTEEGFPIGLRRVQFQAIIIHYSFADWHWIDKESLFLDYIKTQINSYKIAFFQDEYHNCPARFRFLNDFKFDCVFTLLDPKFVSQVYGKFTKVKKYVHTLTGYVEESLALSRHRFVKPFKSRTVDVAYRGRQLPYYMGKGSQEKAQIAEKFLSCASGYGLIMDIKCEESSRIYGDDWYRFLANSVATLGVESGVSVFDLDQTVQRQCEEMQRKNPLITFDEIESAVLLPYEDKIPYRTSSPRIFEAAALKCLQIMYEGHYSGIVEPMVHYVPLKKDFSNIDDVVRVLRDEQLREKIVSQAEEDLVESGRYSYTEFIRGFDRELVGFGLEHSVGAEEYDRVHSFVYSDYYQRKLKRALAALRSKPFPGRGAIKWIYKSFTK